MSSTSRSGLTGLRYLLSEIKQFAPPWVPLTIVGVPCLANAYGMILFKRHSFFNNKPSEDASKYKSSAAE